MPPRSHPTYVPGPGPWGTFCALAMCPQPEPLHLTRRKWKKMPREAGRGLRGWLAGRPSSAALGRGSGLSCRLSSPAPD